MMKCFIMLSISILLLFIGCDSVDSDNTDSCPLEIEWQNTYVVGQATSIVATSDGGYAVVGDRHGYKGTSVLKLNSNGKKEWVKSFEGFNISDQEYGQIITTSDNGLVIAGQSSYDYSIVKLNSSGDVEWKIDSIGGSEADLPSSLVMTQDGSFVIAGTSKSSDGDISNSMTNGYGDTDGWVVKINSSGEILWDISLGTTYYEKIHSIISTDDGGFVVAGEDGSSNFWVVKLNSSGGVEWDKSFGSSNIFDESIAYSITNSSDGGFGVAGYSVDRSTDGVSILDINFRVMKLDGIGEIIWDKTYGGSSTDRATSIIPSSDGGFIVAGSTGSNDGDVTNSHAYIDKGGYYGDMWIIKLNSLGILQWDKSLGGTSLDEGNSIIATLDGGFAIAGYTYSYDFDALGNSNMENYSYWVVKLK